MRLKLPSGLRYPITVTELLKDPGTHVDRDEPIFKYTYKAFVEEDDEWDEPQQVEKTFPSRFESEAEGEELKWLIHKGQTINASLDVAEVEEACTHEMQWAGVCSMCGKDMTLSTGYNARTTGVDRAAVNMVHDNTQLRVSANVALKAETEAKRKLIGEKKLSLVVDLDMTIIHATVDPTVAEWQQDPENPNYEAVVDVGSFRLKDSDKAISETTYYIKMRPGLKHFLEEISKLYELHIYTMGTRAYAEAVAKIVDPDKKYFGDRILSRDESGSMAVKNLQRLFPFDQKMAVIIDDRADVWKWSGNLIRVSAFDFFTGSGDINGSFLPPKPKLQSTPASETAAQPHSKANGTTNGTTNGSANGDGSTLEQLLEMNASDDRELADKTEKAAQTIENQVKDRPLAQKQLALDQKEESESQSETETDSPDKQNRQSLLNTQDQELTYIEWALRQVHTEFYEQHAQNIADADDSTSSDLAVLPDVKDIMFAIKHRVFGDCSAVFSGVVPIDQPVRSADLVIWAMTFGLTVRDHLRKSSTHLIAVRKGTAKVKLALRQGKGKIKVVNTQWLMDSILRWKKQDEGPYMLHSEDDYISPLDARTGVEGDEGKLSDSEDPGDDNITDGDTTDGEKAKPDRLRIRTNKRILASAQLEPDTDEEVEPDEPFDDKSPIGGDAVTWEGMDDELDEFMNDGSDDSDSVADTDSVVSGFSRQKIERPRTPRPDDKPSAKRRLEEVGIDGEDEDGPRKRSRDDEDAAGAEEDGDEDDWDALWEQEEGRRSAENSPEEKEEGAAFPTTKGDAGS